MIGTIPYRVSTVFVDAPLGGGIARHGDVTIQMILAQIQDNRGITTHALRCFELETG